MRITKLALCGALAFVAGCEGIWKNIEPDRWRTGITARRVKGSYRKGLKFKVKEDIGMGTIQGNKKIDEKLDAYVRFNANRGFVEATPLNVQARGEIESGELGLSYFPLRNSGSSNKIDFSLDFGGEFGRANFDMIGSCGPIYSSVHDRVLFWGGKVGATIEYKVNDKFRLITSGGYSFTDNHTNECSADFDGAYFFVGGELRL